MSSSKGTLAVWVSCLFSTLKHWSELLVQTSGLKFLPGMALSIWSWCLRQLLFQHTSVYLEWGCCHWWTMPSLHPSEQSCRGPTTVVRIRQQATWKVILGHSRKEAAYIYVYTIHFIKHTSQFSSLQLLPYASNTSPFQFDGVFF